MISRGHVGVRLIFALKPLSLSESLLRQFSRSSPIWQSTQSVSKAVVNRKSKLPESWGSTKHRPKLLVPLYTMATEKIEEILTPLRAAVKEQVISLLNFLSGKTLS